MEENERTLRLSKSVTELFNKTLEDSTDAGFECINFVVLLSNVMGAILEDGSPSQLLQFMTSNGASANAIDLNLTTMIMDYAHSLETEITAAELDEDESDSKISNETNAIFKKTQEIAERLAEETGAEFEAATICMKPDFFGDLFFTDNNCEELVIGVNKDVFLIHEKLLELACRFNIEEVEILHLTIAMFMVDIKPFQKFFILNNVSYPEAKRFFSPERLKVIGTIPLELMEFLETKNDKVDISRPCEILMRDTETEKLISILLKKNKRNSVIVGEAGVGKSALVEKLTYDIASGNCPSEFNNFKVIALDVNALIAGTTYRGSAELRIKKLVDFLEFKDDIILFIDEVHTILGAGSCFEGEMDLANALKPLLARGDTIVIGATTEKEYEKYFKKDAALSRRFEPVVVNEPKTHEVYPMIKNKLKALSEYHNVNISKSMVQYAIMIASAFAFNKKNPDKTLDLIDRAMVTAKRNGWRNVTKSSILKNFDIYFDIWKNMSDESKGEVTHHELGHYVVGKASTRLFNYTWLAVSIMPSEDYLGITMAETNDKIPLRDINYFIDYIAYLLGGRVSENLFTGSYTEGATADLDSATKAAFNVVTKTGMTLDSIRNFSFLNTEEYPMFSERSTNQINSEVKKLVEAGYTRATEILKENQDILEAIAPVLMKKKIMSEIELDRIWQDVVKKRNK